MKSWKTPTPEQVSRAVALLGRVEQYRYFFDRLENPLWLKPLAEKEFFQRPPAMVRDEARGTVGFLPWPESRYLTRMAHLPKAQEQVLQIALKIPDTDNIRVHEDLADMALALPARMAKSFVPKAKQWIESPYHSLLPEKLGALIAHLARGSEGEAALDLAGAVLAVFPDPRAAGHEDEEDTYRPSPEPRAHIDTWDYEQILEKCLPALVEATGERALQLLCGLLEAAVRISRRARDQEGPEDYSYIWRPAIEEHEQNHHPEDIRGLLVSAVRDAVEQLARSNPEKIAELVALLEARPWKIFHRIALHLLRLFPDKAPSLVAERLTDRARLDDPGFQHEYFLLAQHCFGQLAEQDQETILRWIEEGPDLEAIKDFQKQQLWEQPTDEAVEWYKRIWQRDRLAPLAEALPEEWKRRYECLVAELGPPEHPEFASYTLSGWGPTSPKSVDELQAMTVDELVAYLKAWEPPKRLPKLIPMGPSREGLGDTLTELVAQEPERFAEEAWRFKGMDPTYIRGLLRGLRDAVKEKRSFPWHAVLDLVRWVVEQPREIPGNRGEYTDLDPGWVWTRKAVADLLYDGFGAGPAEIPYGLRRDVWAVLCPLTEDPDPTLEHEATYRGTSMELSLNTTRGEAMHAVVRYALWVRRHLKEEPDTEERLRRGFEEMPEVREVLDLHLDPKRDPVLAIRAVYGQWFPWLVLLDKAWAKSQLGLIFPTNPDGRALHDTAWETYLRFCSPYDNVFEILRDGYQQAVEGLGSSGPDTDHPSHSEERLAEHLMTFYWRGRLEKDEPGGLLSRFFEKATDRLRGHAIEFVGRSLRQTQDEVPPAILDRLRALWTQRLNAARTSSSASDFLSELSSFGWWFVSGMFDGDWAIEQLQATLELAKKAEPDHLVAEKLAEIASKRPFDTVRCLEYLVEGDREGWKIRSWEKYARAILESARASGDYRASEAAKALINRLGTRGYLGFRDLLS